MASKEKDIRVIRSRALLLDALLELLKEKEYKDITIKELTDEASVARQTFYRNFSEKDDILLQSMDEVFDDYFSSIKEDLSREKNINEIAEKLFLIWKDNKKLFVALQKAGLIHKILERFTEYQLLIHEQIEHEIKNRDSFNKYMAHFISGGTYMVLNMWFNEKMKVPVSEMSDVYDKIIRFLIETIKKYGR
jgi:AcrR family transcriptional regulator